MNPTVIIQQAAAEGVRVLLGPTGNLKVSGDQVAVNRWRSSFSEHKKGIVALLQQPSVPPLTRKDESTLRTWLKDQGETDPVLIAEVLESARHNVQWRAAEIAAYKSDPANYCGHGALWLANLGCPQ